jgi:hypothetical protein
MARATTHKDVEYAVDDAAGKQRTFKKFDEAAGFALSIAVARGESVLDVLVWSKAGAKWYGGDDAVAEYNEDPEASVFQRFQIKVNAQGRVP